jgi:hypothetical protein
MYARESSIPITESAAQLEKAMFNFLTPKRLQVVVLTSSFKKEETRL